MCRALIRDTDATIKRVDEFSYLGSLITSNGKIDAEIDKRIANAFSVSTKRKVYQACVLSVLLYGGECWTPLKKHLEKLSLVPRPSRGRREKAWYRLHAHAPNVLQILENPFTYGYFQYTTPQNVRILT